MTYSDRLKWLLNSVNNKAWIIIEIVDISLIAVTQLLFFFSILAISGFTDEISANKEALTHLGMSVMVIMMFNIFLIKML